MRKIIFLIGRESWQKDDSLNHILLSYLKKTRHEIIWEDAAGNLLHRFRRFENKLKWLPDFVKVINLRCIQICYGLFHWDYFVYLYDRKNNSVELRIRKLKKSLEKLGNNKEIIILSRSAGGRFSSCIADDLSIKHIICLSYPFKHPEMNVEPERYLHLKDLKTPMLIIQGENDEYGGIEVKEKYVFSPAIELFFINTNHDFRINKNEWEKVLTKIDIVINSK